MLNFVEHLLGNDSALRYLAIYVSKATQFTGEYSGILSGKVELLLD